jgi:aspartate/methionine/tyrosine aminotransferase
MKPANSVLSSYGTTVFEVMSRLAMEHESINLGQGFPDKDGPEDLRQVAAYWLINDRNQYPPMMGLPDLRQAVALHNKRFYDLDIDWQTEVLVTSGATEALAACMLALIEPGDEVVLIEPLYDCYLPLVRRAGGVPKLVRIEPPNWDLPREALREAFSNKTKLILLNSPHNPASKVFGEGDLSFIAELVKKYDAYAVCDEVYEHIVFDGNPHIPLMTLDGMRERCLRIGSAGKTFSMTGWKVGYVTATPNLLAPITKAHQFLVFTTPPDLQKATAVGLGKDDTYFEGLAGSLQTKRDRLRKGLEDIGMEVMPVKGTYFMTADFRPLGFNDSDEAFCQIATVEARVTPLPFSAFYQGNDVDHFVRFCFAKQDHILDQAIDRLARYFKV